MLKTGIDNKIIATAEIRALSEVSPWRSVAAIAIDWLIIALAIAAGVRFSSPVLYFALWLVIGTRMYALYSLLHDGIHYLLFPNRQVNDWICRLFLAWPLFISFNKIRKFHLAHHQHLKTEEDPEAVHLAYSEFQFPKTSGELAFIFLKDITGVNFLFYKVKKVVKFVSGLFKRREGNESKRTASSFQFEPGHGSILFGTYTGAVLYRAFSALCFVLDCSVHYYIPVFKPVKVIYRAFPFT